ncbi:AI-2E family transporter [Akkermansia muciniphila]|nr:AI-2E family transporter [Akkermansia muciniphila]
MLLISPTAGIIVAGGYLVINTALGNCLEPMLLGRQFGIVTSMVLLSVIFWGWVWGPIGMLLAVPITMLIKLGLESSKDLAWIAQLIDNPPTPRFPLPLSIPGKPTKAQPRNNPCIHSLTKTARSTVKTSTFRNWRTRKAHLCTFIANKPF